MKITFQADDGTLYATSPEISLSQKLIDKLHIFCANEWAEVPEVELYGISALSKTDDQMVLWFDSSEAPFDFQCMIDDMSDAIGFELPIFPDWERTNACKNVQALYP